MHVELRNIAGTEAAVGWAGSQTIVVDRPPGKAGGQGLGFNGAEMLALTLGGCFCNDLRYASHELGRPLDTISVGVEIELNGDPLLATAMRLAVACKTADGSDAQPVIDHASRTCMVSNSLRQGIDLTISTVP